MSLALVSSLSLACGFTSVAWPAQRFQIVIVICAAVGFGYDVIDRCGLAADAIASALLAYVTVAFKDAGAPYLPRSAITTLMPALSWLVGTPSITCMLLPVCVAVTTAVSGYRAASFMAAGPVSSCWHQSLPADQMQRSLRGLTSLPHRLRVHTIRYEAYWPARRSGCAAGWFRRWLAWCIARS